MGNEELDSVGACECEAHEKEERMVIRIETTKNDNLVVTHEIDEGSVGKNEVEPGKVWHVWSKPYSELKELGPGRHEICRCVRMGAPGDVFKPNVECDLS